MTQQKNGSSSQPCPSCNRPGGIAGVLKNSQGQWQTCPNCGGTGQKSPAVIRVPFDYVFPSAVLTANQQGLQNPLQFDFDADFEHIWTVANSTGLWSISLFDTSVGRRQFSNNPVNGENYAGSAALPFPLVEPYLWARAATALATFNDRSGSGNTVQLVFRGYKLFPSQAPMQGSAGAIFSQTS
jgi:hypothetical protein